jgi:uncharacterized protein YbjT (DUF2867 family)
MSRRPGSSPFQAVVGDLRDAAAVDEALRDTDGVVVSVEPPYDDAGAER